MEIYNILKLTNSSFIEFEFNTELEKHNLPIFKFVETGNKNTLVVEYIYNVECYKISKDYRMITDEKFVPIYRYKIVGTYVNHLDMIKIILNIEKHIYGKIILMINNNQCKYLVDELIDLDCFNTLVLGKKFTNPTYSLDKMKGIKYVIYKSKKINKIPILPPNIQILKINLNKPKNCHKLIYIPNGVKKIIYNTSKNYFWIVDMENIDVKKILFVDECKHSCCQKQNIVLNDYDCLINLGFNELIDSKNLPIGVKILKLLAMGRPDNSTKHDFSFDYLPDSVESIHLPFVVDGKKLLNLPTSVKNISFDLIKRRISEYANLTYISELSLNELPDTIEIINLFLYYPYLYPMVEIKHLPKMLKKINIYYKAKSNTSIKTIFEEYKKKFNFDFLINENFENLTDYMYEQNTFSSLNFTTEEKINKYVNLSVEYKKNNRKSMMTNNRTTYYETYHGPYYGPYYGNIFR